MRGRQRSHILVCCALLLVLTRGNARGFSSALAPPTDGTNPIELHIGLFITNLAQVDEVQERFTIRGTIFLSWKDPRLETHGAIGGGPRQVSRDEIWIPTLEIVNATAPRESSAIVIDLDPDGTVHYAESFGVSVSTALRLQRFPFDSQSLTTVFQPIRGSDRVIRLIPDESSTGLSREKWAGRAQWKEVGMTTEVHLVPSFNHRQTVHEAEFDLNVSRRSAFFIWKVFLPLLIMVVISWSTFWVQITDYYSQITIALTTILTVIAFSFSISGSLPRVQYLTFIDAFFLTSYVFVFLSILELMVIHNLVAAGHERRARRVRQTSRWAFPIAYAVVNALLTAAFLI